MRVQEGQQSEPRGISGRSWPPKWKKKSLTESQPRKLEMMAETHTREESSIALENPPDLAA